ncbi:LOW QUALITY PROTEIN: E3 ubiquitin-protein ligase ZNRF4 [Perognathus longimembris pacificus]|uniref:LOW QUALITY PROTEIN: E3 ubiquitin-protein ligase ZNRF4 n=1 Tax=Perognathus longimembris pacificus TaxID=214514 RepID=UPI002019D05C|nr:LOW QUALITY PROTEIN: E3 ubiquitin-protein ligase ZNRF4 [Perognathus longimembris pacificus]
MNPHDERSRPGVDQKGEESSERRPWIFLQGPHFPSPIVGDLGNLPPPPGLGESGDGPGTPALQWGCHRPDPTPKAVSGRDSRFGAAGGTTSTPRLFPVECPRALPSFTNLQRLSGSPEADEEASLQKTHSLLPENSRKRTRSTSGGRDRQGPPPAPLWQLSASLRRRPLPQPRRAGRPGGARGRRGPGREAGARPGPAAALLVLALLLSGSEAVVRAVLWGNSSSVDFADLPALFGVPLAPEGVRGYLVEARPANACQPIEGPRPGNGTLGAIALIRRYDCAFDLKVLHAQRAGFEAAIVHNVRSDGLVRMAPGYEDLRRQIAIPAVFVGEAASQDLRVLLRCDKSAHVWLLPESPGLRRAPARPALALAWALGRALALAAPALLLARRLWLRAAAAWCARAPAAPAPPPPAHAHKAQVQVFTRLRDLCAICLDEYEEGERLKILPCSHAYHCRCIDPWFALAAQRACPMCKQVGRQHPGRLRLRPPTAWRATRTPDAAPAPSLPGHPPPIWAIQAQLRSRRLQLLARAGPRARCSSTSLAVADQHVASSPDGSPRAS